MLPDFPVIFRKARELQSPDRHPPQVRDEAVSCCHGNLVQLPRVGFKLAWRGVDGLFKTFFPDSWHR